MWLPLLSVLTLTGAQPRANFNTGRVQEKTEKPAVSEPVPPAPVLETPAAPPKTVLAPESAPVSPAPVAVPSASVPVPEKPSPTVWLEDDLPVGAVAEGAWNWDSANFCGGSRSHGHPSEKGIHSHAYRFPKPVTIPAGSMITQRVWLDSQDPPKGIALKLELATGEEVGVYWEAEEEVFKPDEMQELWYYGPLPELNKWSRLEILAEDLGLENQQVTGLRFVTYNGHVLWDQTVLTEAPPLETPQALPLGPVEVRPDLGKNHKT